MKLNKFLAVGCAAALVSMAPSVFAASQQESVINNDNNACSIGIHDSEAIRFVNVNYIRFIKIERDENKVLHISLLSDGYSQDKSVEITYPTKEGALKALEDLRNKIDDCQYDAAERRAARKKK